MLEWILLIYMINLFVKKILTEILDDLSVISGKKSYLQNVPKCHLLLHTMTQDIAAAGHQCIRPYGWGGQYASLF
jgi:hypothetical protein